jgi:hypothetical protein
VAEDIVVLGRSGRGSSGTSRCRFWLGGDALSMTSVEWYDYVGGREAPPLTDPHPNPFPSLGARSAPSPGAPRVFSSKKGRLVLRESPRRISRASSPSIRWPHGEALRVPRTMAELAPCVPVRPCRAVFPSRTRLSPQQAPRLALLLRGAGPTGEQEHHRECCCPFLKRTLKDAVSVHRCRLATPGACVRFRSSAALLYSS